MQVLVEIAPDLPQDARKLFSVIVQQIEHGPIRNKPSGVATPPEILEACGLDVGHFYELLNTLARRGAIVFSGTYPFEEIRLSKNTSLLLALAQRSTE